MNSFRKAFGLLILFAVCSLFAQAQYIGGAEYFWDTDPGQGSGTAMSAADGNLDSVIEAVIASAASLPSTGKHIFNVRVRDDNNLWGPVFSTLIDVLPSITTTRSIQVTLGEYFWDTDPGQGNGNVMVAYDGAFDSAVETAYQSGIAVPGVLGVHTFNVRVRDAENNWGPVFKTIINVDPSVLTQRDIKVTAAEYFWDADPGQGNGNVMVAFDGSFDSAIETAYQSSIAVPGVLGVHTFNVRVRDAENNWGPLFRTIINVDPSVLTQRAIKVTAGEYFFDTDPGNGNATAMIAFDGSFDEALETLAGGGIPIPVTAGMHVLYIRARDAESNWGPKFGIVVNIDTTITTTNVAQIEHPAEVVVSPNPFHTQFTIELKSNSSEDVEIRLFDIRGSIVRTINSSSPKTILDCSDLSPGIYIVGIRQGNSNYSYKRLVKE